MFFRLFTNAVDWLLDHGGLIYLCSWPCLILIMWLYAPSELEREERRALDTCRKQSVIGKECGMLLFGLGMIDGRLDLRKPNPVTVHAIENVVDITQAGADLAAFFRVREKANQRRDFEP